MALLRYFRAKKSNRRFRLNQKVWISTEQANHLCVKFRWRGKGRYVTGIMPKWDRQYQNLNPVIGIDGIKEIDVADTFYVFITQGQIEPTKSKVLNLIANGISIPQEIKDYVYHAQRINELTEQIQEAVQPSGNDFKNF